MGPGPGSAATVISIPRFTSRRERNLWASTVAVLVAIYASALFAGSLVTVLRQESLLGIAFTAGFLIVFASVVGIALHTRAGAAAIWVAVGVVAVYAMIVVRLGLPPTERTHLFEYGLLATLIHRAMVERKKNHARVGSPAGVAVLAAAFLGWIDEAIQASVPGRVYDLRDVGVNALAGFIAVVAANALRWAHKRRPGSAGADRS